MAWLNSQQRLDAHRRRGADAGRPRRRPHRAGRRRRRAARPGLGGDLDRASSRARRPPIGPGSSASPPPSREPPASRAIASSRRCPACRRIGWRSCASTPKPTCRPGSTRPNATSCCRRPSAFTEEFHARIVRTGFDQWFPVAARGTAPPAVWKKNMLVLLMLYPVVFLFGLMVQTPLLDRPRRPAVRGRAVHRQRRQRAVAYLSGAVDQHPFRLVAAAGGAAPAAARDRRGRTAGGALCRDGVRVLAAIVGAARSTNSGRTPIRSDRDAH